MGKGGDSVGSADDWEGGGVDGGSGGVAGDHRKGPGFESSAGDLSSEVVNSLNYSATDLSDLCDKWKFNYYALERLMVCHRNWREFDLYV